MDEDKVQSIAVKPKKTAASLKKDTQDVEILDSVEQELAKLADNESNFNLGSKKDS